MDIDMTRTIPDDPQAEIEALTAESSKVIAETRDAIARLDHEGQVQLEKIQARVSFLQGALAERDRRADERVAEIYDGREKATA